MAERNSPPMASLRTVFRHGQVVISYAALRRLATYMATSA